MNVTRDEIERYVREDISDPEEQQRIEDALDTDPQAAAWYDEFQAADEPSAETLAVIHGMFAALDRSVWARLQWQEGTQYLAEASGTPRRAVLELPDGQRATLVVHSTGDGLRFDFDALPDRWRPASLAMFCPVAAAAEPLETPVAPARSEAGNVQRMEAYSLAADFDAQDRRP